jgi:hypothetical protein
MTTSDYQAAAQREGTSRATAGRFKALSRFVDVTLRGLGPAAAVV